MSLRCLQTDKHSRRPLPLNRIRQFGNIVLQHLRSRSARADSPSGTAPLPAQAEGQVIQRNLQKYDLHGNLFALEVGSLVYLHYFGGIWPHAVLHNNISIHDIDYTR